MTLPTFDSTYRHPTTCTPGVSLKDYAGRGGQWVTGHGAAAYTPASVQQNSGSCNQSGFFAALAQWLIPRWRRSGAVRMSTDPKAKDSEGHDIAPGSFLVTLPYSVWTTDVGNIPPHVEVVRGCVAAPGYITPGIPNSYAELYFSAHVQARGVVPTFNGGVSALDQWGMVGLTTLLCNRPPMLPYDLSGNWTQIAPQVGLDQGVPPLSFQPDFTLNLVPGLIQAGWTAYMFVKPERFGFQHAWALLSMDADLTCHMRDAGAGLPETMPWSWVKDNNDIQLLIPPLPGDVNGDGMVDSADVTIALRHLNKAHPAYDLNGDGFVDGADITALLRALHEQKVQDVGEK